MTRAYSKCTECALPTHSTQGAWEYCIGIISFYIFGLKHFYFLNFFFWYEQFFFKCFLCDVGIQDAHIAPHIYEHIVAMHTCDPGYIAIIFPHIWGVCGLSSMVTLYNKILKKNIKINCLHQVY